MGDDFKNGQSVKLAMSGEQGKVIGVLDYAEQPKQYLVRYVDAHGCQAEGWFTSAALQSGDA